MDAAVAEFRDEAPARSDPVRRVVLLLLAVYLAPVALVVLLIAVAGLVLCGALRLVARWGPRPRDQRVSGPRRDPGHAAGDWPRRARRPGSRPLYRDSSVG